MPSVVLRLRATATATAMPTSGATRIDGLASIANYLRDAGWKPGVHWGVPVRVPANLNRAAIALRARRAALPASLQAPQPLADDARMARAGRRTGRPPRHPDNEMATPDRARRPNATAYLLTTNYRAILDYNCSNFYALSVGLLADAIARRDRRAGLARAIEAHSKLTRKDSKPSP
jgi:membrane-bound lytic murein transglycosylase B